MGTQLTGLPKGTALVEGKAGKSHQNERCLPLIQEPHFWGPVPQIHPHKGTMAMNKRLTSSSLQARAQREGTRGLHHGAATKDVSSCPGVRARGVAGMSVHGKVKIGRQISQEEELCIELVKVRRGGK